MNEAARLLDQDKKNSRKGKLLRCKRSLALASVLLFLSGCGGDQKEELQTAYKPTPNLRTISRLPTEPTTSTTTWEKSTIELSTTTSSTSTTTTTIKKSSPTTIKRKVSRERTTATDPVQPQPVPRQATQGRAVVSTAYCLTGRMANGEYVHNGAVAMNGVPFGTRYRVVETGAVYTVKDRIGHGSQFDIWMPSCAAARQWGRRTVHIVQL